MNEVMSLPRAGLKVTDAACIVMDRETKDIVSIDGRQLFVSEDHAIAAAQMHAATFDPDIGAEDSLTWFESKYMVAKIDLTPSMWIRSGEIEFGGRDAP